MIFPAPDPTKPFKDQDPLVLAAMCVFGEARNQSYFAQVGVACVIRNRKFLARPWMGGSTITGVVLHPMQFDCFNADDPNSKLLLTPSAKTPVKVWEECYSVAYSVFSLGVHDVTHGAIYYFSAPLSSAPRVWGKVRLSVVLDGLQFYCEAPPDPPAVIAA